MDPMPMSGSDRNRPRGGAFEGTRWSVVLRARAGGDTPAAEAALAELCQAYWYPLYAFVRRGGIPHHEAQDLTQGYFLHLIGRDGLATVDPAKGRFRSFLLASLKHFLAHERDRAQALKRGGGQAPLPIDVSDGESRYAIEPADERTPEAAYERLWAMAVLDAALADLQQEYGGRGKADVFAALQPFLGGADAADSYASAARALQATEGNVKVMVHRLRRRFGELLRARVAHTVPSESEIDEELHYLMSCFAR
jgi:DNA-directed RNA polymerase specialized sigma24 family protein